MPAGRVNDPPMSPGTVISGEDDKKYLFTVDAAYERPEKDAAVTFDIDENNAGWAENVCTYNDVKDDANKKASWQKAWNDMDRVKPWAKELKKRLKDEGKI